MNRASLSGLQRSVRARLIHAVKNFNHRPKYGKYKEEVDYYQRTEHTIADYLKRAGED